MLTLSVRFQITFDLRFEAEIEVKTEAALTHNHLGVGRGGGDESARLSHYHLSLQGGKGRNTLTRYPLFFAADLQRLSLPPAFAVPH
jgi:hypothetical protein